MVAARGGRKTLLHRLFGFGSASRALREAFETEGLLMLEEGIGLSVRYRNFRAPGKRFIGRRVWYTGFLVLTRARLAVFAYGKPLLNLGRRDPRFEHLHITAPELSRLAIRYEAAHFDSTHRGTVEVTCNTLQAQALCELLSESPDSGSARP